MTRTPTETAAAIASRYPRTDRDALARDVAEAIEMAVAADRGRLHGWLRRTAREQTGVAKLALELALLAIERGEHLR